MSAPIETIDVDARVARDANPGRSAPDTAVPNISTTVAMPRWAAMLFVLFALLAAGASGLLWQKLASIQQELGRRSADTGSQAGEARAVAKTAQDLAQQTAAKLALTEAKLSEVALQRSQLEELMQSLSRSRDENLVVDIESTLRLAQQQAQLTGSVEPLLASLKAAEQRIARAAQPRLTPVQRALTRDLDRVKAAAVADLPSLLLKLDDLTRMVDELPLANDRLASAAPKPASSAPAVPDPWWQQTLRTMGSEARALVRVSRIEQPEAVLLSPEQGFFLRENLKLKLLNARLGLLGRQTETPRLDLQASEENLRKYFDVTSRRTQTASALLAQVQTQLKNTTLPRIDDTLAALATAAAGR